MTHGNVPLMVRWLREQGYEAQGLETRFVGEMEEVSPPAEPAGEAEVDEGGREP